jgi:hypothetical protein
MVDFIERHVEKIAGVLSCLDRVVITGTLPDICHAEPAPSTITLPVLPVAEAMTPLVGPPLHQAQGLALIEMGKQLP